MDLRNVIFNPTPVVLGAALAAAGGVFLWWLVRKRQKRLWLPTIRIMRLESRVLPRLVLRLPPLLPFLCYLVLALVLVGLSLRPRTQVFTPFDPNQTRLHLFADLSASVSAHVSLDDYATRLAALYASLKETGRVTVSTSHSPRIHEPASAEELVALIKGQGFHRGGLRLGSALKLLIDELGEVDRLFLVGDRDQHSWTGFHWQYLLDEMDVTFVDLGRAEGQAPQNVFINEARFLSTPSSPTMEWELEVARRGGEGELEGKVNVTYMGRSLGSFPWKLAEGKQRQMVRADWPVTAIADVVGSEKAQGAPLVFELEAPGDALEADNQFRAELLGMKQDVLLIGETAGERLLEDPLSQLAVALEILGFKSLRQDYVKQPGPRPEEHPFMVIVGGSGGGVDRFCPRAVERSRREARGLQKTAPANGRIAPKIWLAPLQLEADYRELCQCYARLLTTTGEEGGEPAFCEHVTSRSQYVGLLPSLGAKQIGGKLGDSGGSLAFLGRDPVLGLEVLAFTAPLTPLKATGINHAQLPILVKDLLTWQGLLEPKTGVAMARWPRLEDVTTRLWQKMPDQEPLAFEELARLRQSNVPLGESLLAEADPAVLPPRWTAQLDWADQQLPAKKDREDPLPWLRLAAFVVLIATVLEGLVGLGLRLWRLIARRPEAVALLAVALLSTSAWGKVEFTLVGYADPGLTLGTLAREVSHRTSIELASKPLLLPRVSDVALTEPWLWVKDLAAVTQPSGRLRADLALWLARGGFLIIESPVANAALQRLTEALRGQGEGWLPLPPDHELMRSFYLLDALPECNGEIWRGFHYDGRLAILAVPYGFLSSLKDRGTPPACATVPDQERSVRIFVNLVMVALATDYKKDQIHLPEILKRLR